MPSRSNISVSLLLVLSFFVFVVFTICNNSVVFAEKNPHSGYVTILLYHKFNDPKSPSTSIDTDLFRAQLQYLKDNDYNVISPEELIKFLNKEGPIPQKAVLITIDDGYRTVFTEAFPILKEFGYPFTVFLYMEAVGRYPDYMTKQQIEEMARYTKVSFGNHSYAHARFARWSRSVSKKEYVKWIEDDLKKSEDRFKKLTGTAPVLYSYPYGEYNKEFHDILVRRGYMMAFTQDPAPAGQFTEPFLIPRYPLVGSWATMKKFKEFLETEPLPVKRTEPPYGILYRNPPARIVAVVENIGNYKNPGIYLSELGWLKPTVNPKTGELTVEGLPALRREINRIGITAFNKKTGHWARFFYMVINRK